MTKYALSENQKAIVLAIARNGWGTHEHFHEAVFGVPFVRSERIRALTGSERASLSRAIRRLEARGLIYRKHRSCWGLTDEGREKMARQGVECRDSRSDELDELELQIAEAV